MTQITGWPVHFRIVDHGTVISFRPLTDEARSWWDDNVDDCAEWQQMGPTFVIDHRMARPIAEAIIERWPIVHH
jgi:hypothetical protein